MRNNTECIRIICKIFAFCHLIPTELFSKPQLTLKPTDPYEGERFQLSCSISIYVPDKINVNTTKYIYYKDDKELTTSKTYVSVAHPERNGNYTCKVTATSIHATFSKLSQTLHIQAKGKSVCARNHN